MVLNIKYFGLITEITGTSEEVVEFMGSSIGELISFLNAKYPGLNGRDFQVAQNMVIADIDSEITGHEIALLPPFSGG